MDNIKRAIRIMQQVREECVVGLMSEELSAEENNNIFIKNYPSLSRAKFYKKKYRPSLLNERVACTDIAELVAIELAANGLEVKRAVIFRRDLTPSSADKIYQMNRDTFSEYIIGFKNLNIDKINQLKSYVKYSDKKHSNPAHVNLPEGTHALLEVKINNKWRLVDPTAGLLYEVGINDLGTKDINKDVSDALTLFDQFKYIISSHHLDNPYYHVSALLLTNFDIKKCNYVNKFGVNLHSVNMEKLSPEDAFSSFYNKVKKMVLSNRIKCAREMLKLLRAEYKLNNTFVNKKAYDGAKKGLKKSAKKGLKKNK